MTQDQLKEEEKEIEKPDVVERQILQAEVVAAVEESPEMLEIPQPVEEVKEVVVVEQVAVVEEPVPEPVKVIEEVAVVEEVKQVVAEPEIEYTRLEREFKDIQENPIPDARITSDLKKANKEWIIKIKGPEGTPYEGGVFKFVLQFSANEPVCKFKSKIWHPQVREDGFGKFWASYDESWHARHLIEKIQANVRDVSEDPLMHVQKNCSYEYENKRDEYIETAKRWVNDFATDQW